jgi:hypothetical protein
MDESGRSVIQGQLGTRRFLRLSAAVDKHCGLARSVLEIREHAAAMAAVKGRRWYAKRLLAFQEFLDPTAASRALIQASRRQIERSRQRIVLTQNILAFSRCCRLQVN